MNEDTHKEHKSKIILFFRHFYAFIISTTRSFIRDESSLKAALLTFYSLISIVPFLAFTLGIAKSFGFDDFLKKEILTTFKEQKELLGLAMQFALALVSNIKSGVIAGLGLIFLFISIFGLLENVEKSLNAIWKIEKSRNFLRRVVDYLAILIICPILFVVSSGLTLFISAQVTERLADYPVLATISPFILSILKFAPYFLSWMLFSFIYLFVPNTPPRILPRLFAGLIAGTFFQLWQWAYFEFQATITSYNAVYGSFAALPLFLIWMQVNYMIFLYGAEIASQLENETRRIYHLEDYVQISPKALALLILHQIAKIFFKGDSPTSIVALSKKFGVPLYKTREILHILEKEGIVGEIKTRKIMEESYQLLINPELLTLSKISDIIDKNMEAPFWAKKTSSAERISEHLANVKDLIDKSDSNLTLKEIVDSLETKKDSS